MLHILFPIAVAHHRLILRRRDVINTESFPHISLVVSNVSVSIFEVHPSLPFHHIFLELSGVYISIFIPIHTIALLDSISKLSFISNK